MVSRIGFGEQLSRQPAETGAERVARGQLAKSRTRPDQREVGDVHGPDRKNDQHAAPEQEQRRPDARDHVVLKRSDDCVKAGVDQDLLHMGEALEVSCVERIHLLLRLPNGRPGFESSDHRPVVAMSRIVGLCSSAENESGIHSSTS